MNEDLIKAFKKLIVSANSHLQFKKIGYTLSIRDVIELSITSYVDKHTIQYKNIICEISLAEKMELEKLFLDKEKELLDIAIENDCNELRKFIYAGII